MKSAEITSVGRGRKRGRKNCSKDVCIEPLIGPQAKKGRIWNKKSTELVGRYVRKEFIGSGIFLGKIVFYDRGLYRIVYEDGDSEDLEIREIPEFLIPFDDFSDELILRKKKLDDFLLNKDVRKIGIEDANTMDMLVVSERAEEFPVNGISCGPSYETGGAQVDNTDDSSSDSSMYLRLCDSNLDAETLIVPPPQLPPSSNIGISEKYASCFFSVYSFLRSFSIRLFLFPFGLDDFVGSLNCAAPNSLLDAIHVALLRALRRHLEVLSIDDSKAASRCLRIIDWSLIDTLTWPTYVVHYLTAMRHIESPEWKEFYFNVINKDYFSLPPGRKLLVLQILCDDVLESPEVRAEIDMRVTSEFGIDSDELIYTHSEEDLHGFQPRYQKTLACTDQEDIDVFSDCEKPNRWHKSNPLGSKHTELENNLGNIDLDRNGDECRLCGMDGTLLCCDGCPSAYHSRCIGVSKTSIPEGSWFCPECTCNMSGPTVTRGTMLGAAEIFGIDSFGQVFLGTCNHLLVCCYSLSDSANEDSCYRYYNQSDVWKVLETLYSSVQYKSLYLEICKAIIKYWDFPEAVLSQIEMVESVTTFASQEDVTKLLPAPDVESHAGFKVDDNIVVKCESIAEDLSDSFPCTSFIHPKLERSDMPSEKLAVVCAGSAGHRALSLDVAYESMDDSSRAKNCDTLVNYNAGNIRDANVNDNSLPANMIYKNKEINLDIVDNVTRNSFNGLPYLASFFRPQAYQNLYVFGDFAASAAANLAVILSEETQHSGANALEKTKKFMSADIVLQIKAFSSAAIRFFWPIYEKKVADVPRERCGWCLSCKAPATSKKACLLNSSALGAIKGSMRILSGLPPVIMNGEGSLLGILSYILYMEKSLNGLLSGIFLSACLRKQWCTRVEQASNYKTIKASLLELEESIQGIALSGDWLKLEDNWFVDSLTAQNTTCSFGSTQKRPGRKSKKRSAVFELDVRGSKKLGDFCWCRGGKVSKFIYLKGILPRKMLRKAARQGSSQKIFGIYYTEGFEIPKRSRQTVWRAAVEMSQNVSQLALQVRYLDLHIKWGDLSRPEQNVQDGKGLETEASAFRNAFIRDKKIVENKIRYGVSFSNQRHLPSRVLKNILEVEKCDDGKDKYWFLQTRVPLYLIKKYGELENKMSLPSNVKSSNGLSLMQQLQLKASRRDAFSYLVRKRDNLDQCSCSFCKHSVLLGDAIICNVCEGYCHVTCTVRSSMGEGFVMASTMTCKQCFYERRATQNPDTNESPTSPLPLALPSSAQQFCEVTPPSLPRTRPRRSVAKKDNVYSVPTKKKRLLTWGLIWKRNSKDEERDDGLDFRIKNVILGSESSEKGWKPECQLCHCPYELGLMYIRCQSCPRWYHADAFELDESQLPKLVGFKCCKCRRIRSPYCPYKPNNPNHNFKKLRPNSSNPISQAQQYHHSQNNTPVSNATPTAPIPQKLPVRRHVVCEERNGYLKNGLFYVQPPSSAGEPSNSVEERAIHFVSGFEGTGSASNPHRDYVFHDRADFEPQTYFSFTELLESENTVAVPEIIMPPCCEMCFKGEPTGPDVRCGACGLCIHKYCSRWDETGGFGDDWICGYCRKLQ